MAKTKPTQPMKISWRSIIFLVLILLAGIVVAPQVSELKSSILLVTDARVEWLVLAFFCVFGAVLSSAPVYRFLSFHKLRTRDVSLVQIAGMFVNRLLPAGIGGIGLNIRYLYKNGHTPAEATATTVANNTLTGFGHMLLVFCALGIMSHTDDVAPQISVSLTLIFVACVSILLVVLVIYNLKSAFADKMRQFILAASKSLSTYKKRPKDAAMALFFAMFNTSFHTAAVYASMQALDVDLSPFVALLALTGGIVLATATPTPGGVVGSEAGISAVLILYGVDTPTAIASALSYRIVSYWLPLIPGLVAFYYIQKKKLI